MPNSYPLVHPRGQDERFTWQLVTDVAAVLVKHGYPDPLGRTRPNESSRVRRRNGRRLELMLFRFLYTFQGSHGPVEPRRETHAEQLQPAPGVDYRAEARASNYPAREHLALSLVLVGSVGRALHEAGWPPVRHEYDYARLVQALRWFASGGPAQRARRGVGQ